MERQEIIETVQNTIGGVKSVLEAAEAGQTSFIQASEYVKSKIDLLAERLEVPITQAGSNANKE